MDTSALSPFLTTALEETHLTNVGDRFKGKVRDVYTQKDRARRLLIATDRQSAFDVNFCLVPLKGQVLNQLSAWWFTKVQDIMPTQVLEVPDPNVMVVKDLSIFSIEIVVRAYLTGSAKTSAWTNYAKGVREFCGHTFPDGMVKNQPFDTPIITPTTKGEESDDLIDGQGIVDQHLATAEQWEYMSQKALELFTRGQQIADERGLILVDTKYEMGMDAEGNIVIADEVHTPDSSRYWVKDSYQQLFDAGQEPESLDKEFFRLWLRERGFEYGDKSTWPEITDEVRLMLAAKYIDLYERMTGEAFVVPEETDVIGRIQRNVEAYQV